MKKILFVNNNLEIGGIQKSLINLLSEISTSYDVTLLLFSMSGKLLPSVPKNVRVITAKKKYAIYGLDRQGIKAKPFLFLFKSFLLVLRNVFSPRTIRKIIGIGQKRIEGYDAVISYTHLFSPKSLNAGCAEFVLEKTVSDNKICFIHCDYEKSGTRCKANDLLYSKFDKIICCSNSVKNVFLKCLPELSEKTHSLRNFYDLSIEKKATLFDPSFSSSFINIVMIARLSEEKGHIEAISALQKSARKDIRFYFIGKGPMQMKISQKIESLSLSNQVFLLGENDNPFPFVKNSDYLLVASKHEAAPMVFDESLLLGTRVISSDTTSAKEMVGDNGYIYKTIDELVLLFKALKKANYCEAKNYNNDEKVDLFYRIVFGS